jgi:hypothetical protein
MDKVHSVPYQCEYIEVLNPMICVFSDTGKLKDLNEKIVDLQGVYLTFHLDSIILLPSQKSGGKLFISTSIC